MDENQIKERMQQVLELVRQDIGTIRTGRATPSLVEDIMVDAYGGVSKLRILELASITAPDPQTLIIIPWDKQVVGEIRKGIEAANTGLSPVISGEIIRINLPPMTTEDREKYVKLLHQKLESGRVMVRQARQDANHEIKKANADKTVSEDEKIRREKQVQELTDQHIEQIEQIGKAKEQELLKI
ncbi:MAG: ribosome recycling factor [Candidatus Blackburnbacteria bacterium RIFCSPLOWO2_01_FULL_41_27]|uniref:Ribosome-recycling factor n=2 Tax=Candidatus Blackburniibacteriota TaxID=1817898 RepID=A0A1G1V833_9BACT|nr:MAG: ribosome recycling factor [Candidatus Blackburnbacteria bacterium RIFCSPHIGHO2_12_FULL_41_13b]OGY13245.1 MAG: ribosome recycling factor [Candidatus Blackburnbacteria bacterium RIFCSPLOWO2_01_FULL_41_27]